MKMLTRMVYPQTSNYEIFEGVCLKYIGETDYGSVAGLNVSGYTAEDVVERRNKIVEIIGDKVGITVMSGEYYG